MLGQVFNSSLALRQEIEQLQAMRIGHGFADASKLLVQEIFELTMIIHAFNRIID